MAASRRIVKKAARKLEQGGGCAPLAGSIMGSQAAEKRKAARHKKPTRKRSVGRKKAARKLPGRRKSTRRG